MLSWTTQGLSDFAVEMEVSHDGGKTWLKDPGFGPLGSLGTCPDPATCQSDGYIGSNGSIFLAVNDEGKAWTSSDGIAWKQIQWDPPAMGRQHNAVHVHSFAARRVGRKPRHQPFLRLGRERIVGLPQDLT
jgi:hypothetical protein